MRKVIALFVLICFVGCKNSIYKTETDILEDFLGNSNFLNKKCVVVIPAYGCGPCVKEAIEFAKINYKNENIIFIFSDMTNKTESIFSNMNDYHNYIHIDKWQILVSQEIVLSKPVVFYIKDRNISETQTIDDTNSKQILANLLKL